MENDIPSNSKENNQDDIQTLFYEGIKLWGATQEALEEQALKELSIFVEEEKDEKIVEDITKQTFELQNVELSEHGTPKQTRLVLPNISPVCTENFIDDQDSSHSGKHSDSDSEYLPSDDEHLDEDYSRTTKRSKLLQKLSKSTKKKLCTKTKITDDALLPNYKARLEGYYQRLEEDLAHLGLKNEEESKKDYNKLKGGLKVPKDVWNKLYEYQKEGVYWLWELHQRSTGGLLGDEMGLGKTVQIIVFLHALQYTRVVSKHGKFVGVGPTLVVCPATVILQWVEHFHEWSPELRVAILHQSGSHQGNKAKLINEINKNKGIIVTTYLGVLKYKGNLCEYNWHYLILDEGHKIRNPTAQITVAVKDIRTPHRIMLTGSPMQNNLTELWSLFDFTNPGMLGNLAIFTEHFANPILHGGFANASPMQEATALSVATTLKNVISPFLLRRMKNDVQDHIQLPNKSEQVLFCSLTDEQRNMYKNYLMSEQVNNVLGRGIKGFRSDNMMKANMLMAITALRKICNHPDLLSVENEDELSPEEGFGYYKRSGKMVVVSALLKIWKKQGHRTLLFSQGRSMIRIFETFLEQQGYTYLKMDGSTSVTCRQGLIERFNKDPYDVFLLTTRVGGLGVNLTGANRVIIYDPDWNPATDSQAKERAWRIGQEKSVTVYRLVSAGTVEEKMYQRQVWKQLLSNKVLIDPSTNKFFKSSDLFDLFSMPDTSEANPETTNIFRESRVKIQEKMKEKEKAKKEKKKSRSLVITVAEKVEFSEDKIQAMKSLAQQIAKSISNNNREKPETKKSAYQQELEEERNKKLEERKKLKQLTPQELIDYNRWKAANNKEIIGNKIDDKVTNTSFETALEQSSKTAKLYHKLTTGQIKQADIERLRPSTSSNDAVSNQSKETLKSKKRKRHSSVDKSGRIDGEQVEGLVKRETKKTSKKAKTSNECQDNYILEHLFTKKGVSGALEHDSVLNGSNKPQSLKVREHADERALKALEALKKSRLENWKW